MQASSITVALRLAWGGAFAGATWAAMAAGAPEAPAATRQFDIPAGPLDEVLARFTQLTGLKVAAEPGLVSGRSSPGVRGAHTPAQALAHLLGGTSLRSEPLPTGGFALRADVAAAEAPALARITVQATRSRLYEADPEPEGLAATGQDSATKMALPILETPQAISVITRESLDRRQVRDVNSALELAAGVYTAGSAFAGHNPRTGEDFSLRGQPLDGGRDVRIDGFSAVSDRNNIDLAPFERVEAVKGPSSMLYGQGSLGGFINLVRKKPQAERSARISLQAGSFDSYRTEADFAGALDDGKKLLGQLTAAYEDSGSFIDGVQSQRAVLAPALEYKLGDRTRAQLLALHQEDRFTPSLGIALRPHGDELRPPDVPRSFYFGVPPSESSRAGATHASLRVDHELSDRWLATLVLQGSRNRLKGIADSYGYGIDVDEVLGKTNLYSSWVAHDNRAWAGELRVDGRFDAFGREHRVLLGVEGNEQKFFAWGGGGYPSIGSGNIYEGFDDAPRVPGASHPLSYRYDDRLWTASAYAQALFGVSDRAKLLLGTRYDQARQRAQDVFNGGAQAHQTDTAMTWRAAMTYSVSPQMTVYGSYAQSFNPVTERARSGDILDPERGAGYELGAKAETADKQLLATVALYHMELSDSPIPDPDNRPDENFSISAGKQRTRGVELELQGKPSPGLTLGLAATWLDSKFIDRRDPNFGLVPGGTVRRQASLYADYELLSGAWAGFGFGGQFVHVGDRIVLTDQNLTVRGYNRMDLHASYRVAERWNVSLQVRNVADARYIEQVNSAYLYAHFFGAPRTVMLRTEYRFQ